MKKQISSLIKAFQNPMAATYKEFIPQFAVCCAWIKKTENNELDEYSSFMGTASADKLNEVINNTVTIHYREGHRSHLSDEDLTALMLSLQRLIQAKVITFVDLSDAIKELVAAEVKNSGGMSIPNEICELGVSLLGNQNKDVYCPFDGGYLFAHKLPSESKKSGEARTGDDVFFADIHNALLDCDYRITNTDPVFVPSYLGEGGLEQFQSSIAFPPMGQKYPKDSFTDIWGRFPEKSLMANVYHLRHMLSQSTDLVVCFVASGFLFRGAAGEKQIKQDLLEKNWLKAIIALPSNLLPMTGIPVNIIVLDKNKTDPNIQFIDASSDLFIEKEARTRNKLVNLDKILSCYQSNSDSEISKSITASGIIENDYNLSPNRYVLSEEEEQLDAFQESHKTAKLEDLVEIIRPQAVKHDDGGNLVFVEYNVASINQIGSLVEAGKAIKVKSADLNKVNKQKIQPNDVLVVCKGAVGKVAIADKELADNAIASQAFSILRIKPHITSVTSEALFQYFVSKFGQLQLTSMATGTSALMLSSKNLSMLQIPLFDDKKLLQLKEVRQKITDTYTTIEQLNNKINELNDSWL